MTTAMRPSVSLPSAPPKYDQRDQTELRRGIAALMDSVAVVGNNQLTALTGDVTGSGATSIVTTLATVNSNVGAFGSSTAIPTLTVNAKGLVTAVTTNVVIAPAGTLTGTTLAANVVTSSLTTIGALIAGAVPASLVTAGTFGAGAYTFPSTLTVTTSMTTPLITRAGAIDLRTTTATSLTFGTNSTTRLTINLVGRATFTGQILATGADDPVFNVIEAGSDTRASVTLIAVNAAAGQYRYFQFKTAGTQRWSFGAENTAEAGADVGSNFRIAAYNDAGALIDELLAIPRVALGAATWTRPNVFPAATTSIPSVRFPHGVAPSSPTNGDLWTTTLGVFNRVNGVTWEMASLLTRLDQFAAPTASVSFNDQQALSFRIENRTSDPVSPTVGQIWLRTDL